ncbi:hypothetical protein PsaNZ64_00115 [Pseudomonas syringae pv. actinidiae]|uniref:hypothetical protein n=1 Tax=Pseudomonas syringae group TaxID=136849 RepID=UPI0006B9F42D|nr:MULTISPECIES: hypothetical protein [Pseudomonas syringae group]KPB17048.1 Unknown protein sequence [Pseudomonas amygdali pv. sesami]OKS78724.1 hypothetical protein PsaNZ64_00115 [Pseudomonas syringae pv. actinidiae]
MSIPKTVLQGGARALFKKVTDLFHGSSTLQGVVSSGAKSLSKESPDKASTTGALVDMFRDKGIEMVQDKLLGETKSGLLRSLLSSSSTSGGAFSKLVGPALAAAVALLTKVTSVLQGLGSTPEQKVQGTPLATLIQPATAPTPAVTPVPAMGTPLTGLISAGSTVTMPAVDPAYTAWAKRDRQSLSEFTHTETQLREKTNVMRLLETDVRNNPHNAEAKRLLDVVSRDVTKAQEMHHKSIDDRVAVEQTGKQFNLSERSEQLSSPIPADWNRPKEDAYIPPSWDQNDGPGR